MTIQEINEIVEKLTFYLDISKLKSYLIDNSPLDDFFWEIDELKQKTFNNTISDDLNNLSKYIEKLKDQTNEYNSILLKKNIISEVTRDVLNAYGTDLISLKEVDSVIEKIKLVSEIEHISKDLQTKIIEKNSKYHIRKEQIYNLIANEGHKSRSRNYLDFAFLAMLNENLLVDDDILELFKKVSTKAKQLLDFDSESNNKIKNSLETFLIRYYDYTIVEKEIEILENLSEIDKIVRGLIDFNKSLIGNLAIHQTVNVSPKIKEHFEKNLNEIKNEQISVGTDIKHKTITESVKEHVAGLIGKHTNWQFPIVYFEPDDGEFTRSLISGDPFYVIDNKSFGYKNVLAQLHTAAKTKIHHYRLSDCDDIPDNTVNLFFAWNKFSITNSVDIDKKFQLINKKLMPGGACILNFNDIGIPVGAGLSDKYQAYPLDFNEIKSYLNKYNLKVINSKSFDYTGYTVLLIKKSGEQPYINLVNKLGIIKEKGNSKPQGKTENLSQFSLDLEEILSVAEPAQVTSRLENSINKNYVTPFNGEKILSNHYLKYYKILNSLNDKTVNDHPNIITAALKLSKLAFMQNRRNEARQTLVRIKREVNRAKTVDQSKKEQFFAWLEYLNNI